MKNTVLDKVRKGDIIDRDRDRVVKSIARRAATFITVKSLEETPNIENAVDMMQDVCRHLMKKLGADRRER